MDQDVLNALSENLIAASAVAFIGAGVSRTYIDPDTNTSFRGMKSASEVVEDLSRNRAYLDTNMSFLEACYLFKEKEGRNALERYLQDNFAQPTQPLPAHQSLADLPFTAYVTTNYDQLLETALSKRKKPQTVFRNDDVSRLRNTQVPVIKIHGCVSDPKTMIASEDQYVPLGERVPIIEALLKTQLANKTILFVGYSLEDNDFKFVYEEVKRVLGDNMPRSYAIVHTLEAYQEKLWDNRGVTLIEDDLTLFLRKLKHTVYKKEFPHMYPDDEEWFDAQNPESIIRIKSSPTETQAIDAFIEHLILETQKAHFTLKSLVVEAKRAYTDISKNRGNFTAFCNTADTLINKIENECKSTDEAEDAIQDLISERKEISRRLKKNSRMIKRQTNILTFSQSVRVCELLSSVPSSIQNTCQLFISECRPKSPKPFEDALAVVRYLLDSSYKMILTPDACMGSLIATHQVDLILLGAHCIHTYNGTPKWFVNTSGSIQLVESARKFNVPIFIVAENNKIIEMGDAEEKPSYSTEEEADLFKDVSAVIDDMQKHNTEERVTTMTIGYDLCCFYDDIVLLND